MTYSPYPLTTPKDRTLTICPGRPILPGISLTIAIGDSEYSAQVNLDGEPACPVFSSAQLERLLDLADSALRTIATVHHYPDSLAAFQRLISHL